MLRSFATVNITMAKFRQSIPGSWSRSPDYNQTDTDETKRPWQKKINLNSVLKPYSIHKLCML